MIQCRRVTTDVNGLPTSRHEDPRIEDLVRRCGWALLTSVVTPTTLSYHILHLDEPGSSPYVDVR